jgi:hypothetical protein
MTGTAIRAGDFDVVRFPGVVVMLHLRPGAAPSTGGTDGTVVNHVGFIVQNVQESVAKWKAAGVPVQPGNNNRMDQAYVTTPDGLKVEILAAPILYRDLLEDAAIILGASTKLTDHGQGNEQGAFAFLALLGFVPVGWFGWKWLRDWPSPGRLAYWRDCFSRGDSIQEQPEVYLERESDPVGRYYKDDYRPLIKRITASLEWAHP